MNSRLLISALQRFVGKPIAIRDVLELVLMAVHGPSAISLLMQARFTCGIGF
jgi:hypothetical protein